MDCCDTTVQAPARAGEKRLVLAGNPNVGKSLFFHALTGVYVTVSNYPGTTLDISSGRYGDYRVIDTTGVYGVSSFNDEERIARDEIIGADLVVNTVDALHLERDLFLTQQIIDMRKPVIVALNMMDEAEKNGISIDIDRLEEELGVPVVPTVAVKNRGIEELKRRIEEAKIGNSCLSDDPEHMRLTAMTGCAAEALLILEGDIHVSKRRGLEPLGRRQEIYDRRRARINGIIDKSLSRSPAEREPFSRKLSKLMLRPLTGIPLLLLLLFGLYQFVGVFIAQTVVGFTEETLLIGRYEPFIRGLVGRIFAPDSIPFAFLAGEFGLLTMPVTYILGLLLPLVVGFYLFLSVLEDSGYMPRIAVLTDRTLTRFGLNGRAVIPMLLGFGCVTMATITTRLLGSKREKFIAVFLLGLTIPCSAQLGVIAGLIAPLGILYFIGFIAVIGAVYIGAGTILNRIVPGKSTDLFIDLPTLRLPRPGNILRKTALKSFAFLKEAGLIFLIGSVVITLFQVTGFLGLLQRGLAPLTERFLGLPPETSTAFIMGIVRRDFGAAGLYGLSLTNPQVFTALIVITLFVPCIAAMMIMIKERNWKEAALIWGGSWITAFAVGGALHGLFSLFGS